MSEWQQLSIKDVALGVYDGPHATPSPAAAGPTFLGIGNVTADGQLDLSQVRHIAEEEFARWTKRVTPVEGDIVFTYEATLNRYAIIPANFRGCLGRRMALLRPDKRKVDTRFLFYSFFGAAWRATIEKNRLTGATVDRIPLSKFPMFPIDLPDLQTQRHIGEILGAYDDLIEVNRRRVALLEDMARELFEEWFVRFRFPGHENITVVEMPEGPVPENWRKEKIGELGKVVTGKTPSKERVDYFGSDVPFIKIPDMHGSMFVLNTNDMLSVLGAATQANKSVPAGSLLVSCIGTIGLVAITAATSQMNQQINAIVPINQVWTEYLYFSMVRLRPHLINLGSNGATMGNVNKQKFSSVRVMCPPNHLIEEYHSRVSMIFSLIRNICEQSCILATSRDLLLPRLISGQLSVSAAERELDAA